MANLIGELVWVIDLLKDLQTKYEYLALMYCDNEVALHIPSNVVFHERMKHIELDSLHKREIEGKSN